MQLTSPAFAHNQNIPSKYTCDGLDVNPPLAIDSVPAGTKSLALIVDDPDAPGGTWVHWTLWNIPPDTKEIPGNIQPAGVIKVGASEGTTSFGGIGWGGPCPPTGVHRYFFKLAALDTTLNLPASTKAEIVAEAILPHILAQAELIGLYQRQK